MLQKYEAPASTSGLSHPHPGFSWDWFIHKILAPEFLSQGLLLEELGFDKYCCFLPKASVYSFLGDDLKFLNI